MPTVRSRWVSVEEIRSEAQLVVHVWTKTDSRSVLGNNTTEYSSESTNPKTAKADLRLPSTRARRAKARPNPEIIGILNFLDSLAGHPPCELALLEGDKGSDEYNDAYQNVGNYVSEKSPWALAVTFFKVAQHIVTYQLFVFMKRQSSVLYQYSPHQTGSLDHRHHLRRYQSNPDSPLTVHRPFSCPTSPAEPAFPEASH